MRLDQNRGAFYLILDGIYSLFIIKLALLT